MRAVAMNRRPGIANEEDLTWEEMSRGESVAVRRKRLAAAAGGDRLGCSLYELPPGKKSWPFHYHTANEEGIYVLEGEGILRTVAGERLLRPGDYVALPTGEEYARRVGNPGDRPLRYLCTSTMREPEISVYPDLGTVGLFAGAAPGDPDEAFALSTYLSADAAVDYWSGERE